jgi:cytochrome b561
VNKKTILALSITLPVVGAIIYGAVYADTHMSDNVSMAVYLVMMSVGFTLAIVALVRWIFLWRKSTPEERKAYTEYKQSWWRRNT